MNYALLFLALAVVTALTGILGFFLEAARVTFIIFIVLFIISLVVALLKRP